MAWKYGSFCSTYAGTGNIVSGIFCARMSSSTAGSCTIPSSMVRNTTGSLVGIRENTGAYGVLMSIGTGVGLPGARVVVVGLAVVGAAVVAIGADLGAGAAWTRGAAISKF